jgi:hypothetical protein
MIIPPCDEKFRQAPSIFALFITKDSSDFPLILTNYSIVKKSFCFSSQHNITLKTIWPFKNVNMNTK